MTMPSTSKPSPSATSGVTASDDHSDKITPAEHAVMDVLWQRSPIAASDVANELALSKGWSSTTVKTLLSRLVEKGALTTTPEGRRFLYSPTLSKDHYARSVTRSFVDRIFGGRAAPLVAHLADGEGLSDDDIAELERLLEGLKHDRR